MTKPKRLTKGELRNYQVSIMGNKGESHMTGMILGANAQLEADEKEKNKEINALLTECKEYHDAVIKEIKEEIAGIGLMLLRFDGDGKSYTEIPFTETDEWREFWQKYLGGK